MSEEKKGPTELVQFNVGHGKGIIDAHKLVNTSDVPLARSQVVMIDGKDQTCGYYSNSSLGTYMRCPRKFEYEYIKQEKGRRLPKLPMWAGIAIHDGNDALLSSMIQGKPLSREDYIVHIHNELDEMLDSYEAKYTTDLKKERNPEPIEYSSTHGNRNGYTQIIIEAADVYYRHCIENVKPVSVEKEFIYKMPVHTGGEVPIVGFIDLIEKIGDEPTVTDHKAGKARTQAETDLDDQLTLYSLAEGIPQVSISNFVYGTIGGKTGRGKKRPPAYQQMISKRHEGHYEDLIDNYNHVFKGIKAASFPKTGKNNPMVCSPKQCAYFAKCMKQS
jgi:hypothetical protein